VETFHTEKEEWFGNKGGGEGGRIDKQKRGKFNWHIREKQSCYIRGGVSSQKKSGSGMSFLWMDKRKQDWGTEKSQSSSLMQEEGGRIP